MDPGRVTIPLAFVAGVLSFVSPCVLPLVPAFLGYLSGEAVTAEWTLARRGWLFLHALGFVVGFSVVFTLLGASVGLLGGHALVETMPIIARVGAVLVVVFGLQVARLKLSIDRWIIAAMLAALITFLLDAGLVRFALNLDPVVPKAADGLVMAGVVILATEVTVSIQMGLAVLIGILNLIARLVGAQGIDLSYALKFAAESILLPAVALFAARTDWFYYEKRAEVKLAEKRTYLTSAVMGVVFAAGWTPCVGPILAAILLLAAQSATVGLGALLLLVYSLGLGIPFLTMGLAFDALSGALRRLSRSMGIVSLVSGVFLVLLGLAMFTDTLRLLSHFGAFFNLGNF